MAMKTQANAEDNRIFIKGKGQVQQEFRACMLIPESPLKTFLTSLRRLDLLIQKDFGMFLKILFGQMNSSIKTESAERIHCV